MICWIFSLALPVFATGPISDSLKNVVKALPEGPEKLDAMLKLVEQLVSTETNQSLSYAKDALVIARKLGEVNSLARSYNMLGRVHLRRGEYSEAETQHQAALNELRSTNFFEEFANTYYYLSITTFYRGDLDKALDLSKRALNIARTYQYKKTEANINNLLGGIYRRKGDLTQSLRNLYQARSIFEEIEDSQGLIKAENNIANVFLDEEENEKALESYKKVAEMSREINHQAGLAIAYNNIGLVYARQDRHEEAFVHYKRSLNIHKQLGYKAKQVYTLNKMAQLSLQIGEYEEGMEYIQQVKALNKQVGDKMQGSLSLLIEGELLIATDKDEEGIPILERGLKQAREVGVAQYSSAAYNSLADAYAKVGNFELAFVYRTEQLEYEDSLRKVEEMSVEDRALTQHNNENQAKAITELEQAQADSRLTTLGLVSLCVGLFLLGGLGLLYYRYRYKANYAALLTRKNDEIAEQNRRLALHNTDLEQFAYVVSHNLKEPLRTIGNYTSLIEKKFPERIGKDGKQFLGYIGGGVRHMHALLANLLVYVQLGKSDIKLGKTDMNEVMQEVERSLKDVISESNAILTIPVLPNIFADKAGMKLVFQNLISNAIKFRGDMPVKVEILYYPTGGYHCFSVQDNGIGMKQEYVTKIFDVFQRLHTQDAYEGTGIGLAISRKVIQQHKGWIEVESELDKGTSFQVYVPISKTTS